MKFLYFLKNLVLKQWKQKKAKTRAKISDAKSDQPRILESVLVPVLAKTSFGTYTDHRSISYGTVSVPCQHGKLCWSNRYHVFIVFFKSFWFVWLYNDYLGFFE